MEGSCRRGPSPTPTAVSTCLLRGKQFIPCHRPGERGGAVIVPHPTESNFQLALHWATRCNRPRRAAVIPMTFSSLPFYRRSLLHPQHIKCSNTQREEAWLTGASTQCLLSPLTYTALVLQRGSLIHLLIWQSESVDAAPFQTLNVLAILRTTNNKTIYTEMYVQHDIHMWCFFYIYVCECVGVCACVGVRIKTRDVMFLTNFKS